ncbi:short chain dehydrogenase [Geodermatophilus saharensis]|uniref:Short chain dehydrogenase n=1 Tax=Geodermatophilus saharensis TaxID=1137994 RepID=A0A239EMC2_9ACTN|nr:SDR family oxidoreductase [Geodermatophilus saharensis]SNS45796.1 short chain dehydrogenase [Geodermatophilus saharensis]
MPTTPAVPSPPEARSGRGVVLVTGASSGLGAEMARQFAALGWDLALCARRTDRLDALAGEIRAGTGRRVETAALDVTDPDAVPAVFGRFEEAFGGLDRVVVNAGVGGGAPLGTGQAGVNRETAVTNFVGALAQCEAAMEVFRRQGRGHLVLISSISALRGMRRSMTVYAATKAGVAALGEGLRSERVPGVDVTVVYPGYIRSEMNEGVAGTRLMTDTEPGVRAVVAAVEARKAKAYVPAWPWVPIGAALRVLPLSVVRRLT